MSKKNKKHRAKAQQAEVRLQSGTSLRAVTPPSVGGKLLELRKPVVSASAPETAPVSVTSATPESVAPAAPVEARPCEEAQAVTSFAEQRTSPRVSVAVDIHLWSDSHFFSDLSGDVSDGGLFLSTYRPLVVGSEVDLEFSLPGTERTVHACGQVRWVREHSAELPRGVGIAFEGLSDEDRDAIHSFCSSRPALYYEGVG